VSFSQQAFFRDPLQACYGGMARLFIADSVSDGALAVGVRPGTQAGVFELFILVGA